MIDIAKAFEDANSDVKFLMVDLTDLLILKDAIFSLALANPGYSNDKKVYELLRRVKTKLKEMENE